MRGRQKCKHSRRRNNNVIVLAAMSFVFFKSPLSFTTRSKLMVDAVQAVEVTSAGVDAAVDASHVSRQLLLHHGKQFLIQY